MLKLRGQSWYMGQRGGSYGPQGPIRPTDRHCITSLAFRAKRLSTTALEQGWVPLAQLVPSPPGAWGCQLGVAGNSFFPSGVGAR